MEWKGVDALHYFCGVRDVDLILWSNLVIHPRTFVQDFRGIKILRQTIDDPAPMADKASASLPFSPLPTRFNLMDLDVGGDGVDCV